MLKKISKPITLFVFIAIFTLLLSGCKFSIGQYTINNLSVTKKKPFNFYYTNQLAKNLTLESKVNAKLIDMGFYKEKDLSKEDMDTVKNFLKSLKKENFVDKPKDIPSKPSYKIFFTFSKDKYVINVFNEKYISIYPWDGSYTMDYIDMNGIYSSYNMFKLSKYLIPR